MSAFARVIARRPRAWLAVMVAITGLAIAGIGRLQFDSSLQSMTVRDDPERLFHEQTEATFGDEEIGVVAVVVDDAYTVPVLQALRTLSEQIGAVEGVSRALSLATASDAARDVISPPPLMPRGPVTEAAVAHVRERVPANPAYVPHLVAADGRAVAINIFFADKLQGAAAARVDAEIARIVAAYSGPGTIYFTGVTHIQARAVQLMRADLLRF
ncbi:MAG: hypothetical protein MUF70_15660, partial [Myxococcota bacterium]|nr:hypothetical protein [Myxococcota bacterium]